MYWLGSQYKLKMNNKEMMVEEILHITNGILIVGDKEAICSNFSIDTRTIKQDDIYVGIKGEKIDGNIFWEDALSKGAKGVIIQGIDFNDEEKEKYSKQEKIIIKVDDTLEAFGKIAKLKRKKYNMPVVGITGSVGKTSTIDIIASVLSQKYNTLKTEGNNNNNIGLPKTILGLKNEEAAVLEMGMNHLKEIEYLSNIAKPTISVITNIGTSHIGNLGSRENILKAKLEILEGMKEKILVINNDNDLLHNWYQENKENADLRIVTYGIHNESDIMASNIDIKENCSKFTCRNGEEKIDVYVPTGGEHFVYNAMCGFAVGKVLNLSNEEILKGIESFELTKKRMETISLKNDITLINDAYNASYESIKEALKYINNITAQRKIAVLGDIFELGEFAQSLHEKVGEEVAKNGIDILICSGGNAKYIVQKAMENGMNPHSVFYEKTIKETIDRIQEIMKEGDVILIKASNGMKFFTIPEELIKTSK